MIKVRFLALLSVLALLPTSKVFTGVKHLKPNASSSTSDPAGPLSLLRVMVARGTRWVKVVMTSTLLLSVNFADDFLANVVEEERPVKGVIREQVLQSIRYG